MVLGEYNDRCLENEMSERCSLQSNGGENNENYSNCPNDYSNECQNQYQDECQNEYPNQCMNDYQNDGGQYDSGQYDSGQYDNEQFENFVQKQYTPEAKGPEILYKSSKELYKAVAKECGITCKMSDQCRCYECQSRYFDCEYDQVSFTIYLIKTFLLKL